MHLYLLARLPTFCVVRAELALEVLALEVLALEMVALMVALMVVALEMVAELALAATRMIAMPRTRYLSMDHVR